MKAAFGESVLASSRSDTALRAQRTLEIMHRWGYAPALKALASELLGGDVAPEELERCLRASATIIVDEGFACLRGHEDLLERSRRRSVSHRDLNGEARAIARQYAADLVRLCPFIDCVAVSGSVASGGYQSGDDIDFDLFVRSGTKYVCYLLATLVGLKYAWRYRHREFDELHRTPFLPKITCVNVVWPEDQVRPFARQDADVAFELMRCRPLFGARWLLSVLRQNPWLREYFPQLEARSWTDEVPAIQTSAAQLLASLGQRRRVLTVLDAASRYIAWVLYSFVQWTRSGNPDAVARMRFMRQVKWPYEVFQD